MTTAPSGAGVSMHHPVAVDGVREAVLLPDAPGLPFHERDPDGVRPLALDLGTRNQRHPVQGSLRLAQVRGEHPLAKQVRRRRHLGSIEMLIALDLDVADLEDRRGPRPVAGAAEHDDDRRQDAQGHASSARAPGNGALQPPRSLRWEHRSRALHDRPPLLPDRRHAAPHNRPADRPLLAATLDDHRRAFRSWRSSASSRIRVSKSA